MAGVVDPCGGRSGAERIAMSEELSHELFEYDLDNVLVRTRRPDGQGRDNVLACAVLVMLISRLAVKVVQDQPTPEDRTRAAAEVIDHVTACLDAGKWVPPTRLIR